MSQTSLLYIQIAQDYLADHQPLIPRPGNGLEQIWFTLAPDTIQAKWDEAKALYEKYKNDTMGRMTGRRRLAFIYQRADELDVELA